MLKTTSEKFQEEWAVNVCVRAGGKNGNVKCQRSSVKETTDKWKNIHQHQPTAKHMRNSETDRGVKYRELETVKKTDEELES